MDSITLIQLFRNTPVVLEINKDEAALTWGTPIKKCRPAVRKGARVVGATVNQGGNPRHRSKTRKGEWTP